MKQMELDSCYLAINETNGTRFMLTSNQWNKCN